MNARILDALLDLLVRRSDDAVTSAELVDWATSALAEGSDTPALAILAGLPRDSSIAEPDAWLQKALSELSVEVPAPSELRRAYVGAVSRAVLEQRLACQTALDLVHRYAVNPLNHPTDLMPWCYVWEGLAPVDFRDLDAGQVEEETRALAEQWAGRPPLPALPSSRSPLNDRPE